MSEELGNTSDDQLFKEAASLYIEKHGEGLLSEALFANSHPLQFMDINRVSQKMKAKRRASAAKKITAALLPAAACFILIISYFTMPGQISDSNIPDYTSIVDPQSSEAEAIEPGSSELAAIDPLIASETAAAEFLSARLPQGFDLVDTDIDTGQMIGYIKSGNNEIVLVMEEWQDIVSAKPMTQINVNGTSMYVLRMNDYSLLTYKKGDLRFTLTSPYDYRDLIVIGSLLV